MYLASIILQNLVLGTQILLVALVLYLVFSAGKVVHLAAGAIGTAAAYGIYWGILSHWPLGVAIGFGFLISVLLGILSAELLEPFSKRSESLLGLLVSLALTIILESLIAIIFGTDGKSLQSGILPVVNLGVGEVDLPGVVTIVFGVALALTAWLVVRFTTIGRLLRAVSQEPAVATSLGVSNKMVRYLTHITAAVVAGVVVTLIGWHTALTPLMGFSFVVAAFIALMIGGVSDLRGAVIASYLIAVFPGLVIGFSDGLSENWRLVFVFCIAVLLLAIRPNGLFTKKMRAA